MNPLTLPERTSKPRSFGINSIHDVKLTTLQLEAILNDHSAFLDIAKLGVGSAYVTPKLRKKIDLYKEADCYVYFGGTLFEKFYSQGKVEEYKNYMDYYGISWVEISTGTIELSIEERVQLVTDFSKHFTVLSEVGSKDADYIMAPSTWISEIQALLDAGSKYVITEGRNSGTAGVYRKSGEIRTGLIEDIIHNAPVNQLIFEAPTAASQMYFINLLGSNVNLGNINPNDLLLLEAQRCGLRSETFSIQANIQE